MSDNNGDLGAFLAGFVIGGLVGAAVALIMAPQSGEETRARISTRSAELRDAGTVRLQSARERAGEYGTDYRERARNAGASAQERARLVLDEGKERFSTASDSVRTRVNDVTSRIKKSDTNGDAPEAA